MTPKTCLLIATTCSSTEIHDKIQYNEYTDQVFLLSETSHIYSSMYGGCQCPAHDELKKKKQQTYCPGRFALWIQFVEYSFHLELYKNFGFFSLEWRDIFVISISSNYRMAHWYIIFSTEEVWDEEGLIHPLTKRINL